MVVHTPIPAIQEVVCQLELHVHFQWVWKYLAAHAELKCASVEIQKVNEKIPSQESTKAI